MRCRGCRAPRRLRLDQVAPCLQRIVVHGPLTADGSIEMSGRIANVYDKGKAAFGRDRGDLIGLLGDVPHLPARLRWLRWPVSSSTRRPSRPTATWRNPGVLGWEHVQRLKPVTPSLGMMLEATAPRLLGSAKDVGGTLMEETISRMADAQNGSPQDREGAAGHTGLLDRSSRATAHEMTYGEAGSERLHAVGSFDEEFRRHLARGRHQSLPHTPRRMT